MKSLQRLCASIILALALALPAFAGEIPTPGDVSPPPPPPSQNQISTTGDMGCPGVTADSDVQSVTAIDPITDAALSLLEDMLSGF